MLTDAILNEPNKQIFNQTKDTVEIILSKESLFWSTNLFWVRTNELFLHSANNILGYFKKSQNKSHSSYWVTVLVV